MIRPMTVALAIAAFAAWGSSARANTIDIDFNSGADMFGVSQGTLYFVGQDGFQVIFTDDESNGPEGGNANGVHITNTNFGNRKVGNPTDFVLGAYNASVGGNNYHSSGIVATFNQGATRVSFLDTDDDGTTKALYAYDQNGVLIAQSPLASQTNVIVDAPSGKLIYRVEFDTLPGTAGGSNDGTYFTIDNFHAEGVSQETQIEIGFPVPEPATVSLALAGLAAVATRARRRK